MIRLHVPKDVIKAKCSRYMARGKPTRRPELMNEKDHAIISRYGAEYRGIVQYYLLAGDVSRLNRLHWVMETSLLKTLAGKYDSSVSKMARKYPATIETPYGPHKCLQLSIERGESRKSLVATFGGIPLKTAEERGPATTASPSRPPPAARSWFTGSRRDGARSADKRIRCKSTRSASSQTSTSPDSQSSPNGCRSWQTAAQDPCGLRQPATPTSITGGQPRNTA